ncbi:uncharacterized protein LOC121385877 isoform X2 [Gigantopelta aegis]|uniref:uncharacterized protein LOC121385877 isoform X2 n=1 Tax=Gigantopelta aegis TaxID=1735272 RepID=UPI001B8895AB|nr:uncharacterized protein LOC121385877 isoform X2 [Gigantopelta aegis]
MSMDILYRELDRIAKANDDLSNQEKRNELDKKILLKANWFANSEKKVVSNRCKQQQVTIRDEVRQAHKAWIKVRREALKQLFEKEYMVYDKEFESMGKAFQRDRM